MKLPRMVITKADLMDILYRIARNERHCVTKRVESIEMICRLKKYSGFPARPGRVKEVPAQAEPAAPVQEPLAPSADLLGLIRAERHQGAESATEAS